MSRLIYSGIQPSGRLHLGNFLGAIRNWTRLAEREACLFCVVDMHATTTWQAPAVLSAATREAVACLLACGLRPESCTIYRQSDNAAQAELAWILGCVARMGWLNRMTQFKEKAGRQRENVSVGLFSYPVLMAADILAFRATHVPVGDDQRQHLELVREIAGKFNTDYGVEMFPAPEGIILETASRVMSLRDGTKKMSKSDPSEYSRIYLDDSNDAIADKLAKAKTDPLPLPETVAELSQRPEACNLIEIYAALSGDSIERVVDRHAGQTFSVFKVALTDVVVSALAPIAANLSHIRRDRSYIDRVIAEGGDRARAVSGPIVAEVKRIVGYS